MGPPPGAQAQLAELRQRAQGCDAHGVLEIALKHAFGGQAAVVSSFGAESAVLLHLVAQIDPNTPILFLNTGKLFGETLRYRDRLQEQLGLCDVRSIGPDPRLRQQHDPDGTLWSKDVDACCEFRKVLPLRLALSPFSAQITGRKRFQTGARASMERIEFFEGRFRFNPLADWSQQMLTDYMRV
ncbi:MAG: phosphoadenylyl-sulfate reductase, partial [Alphaproteobacteria bacterium]|nr:phosphoadenylyl-sulfate reductase [Alphaproteobacteria bacterium]